MQNILQCYPKLIQDIINLKESKDVYDDILKRLSSVFTDANMAIFFVENTSLEFKAASNIKKYDLNELTEKKLLLNKKSCLEFKTVKDTFFKTNTLALKLEISGSVFGYFLYTSDKNTINKDIITSLVSILSYKIKDWELKEVFKIQLKAMQDAINDKNEALEIIKKQHKKLQELDKTKNSFLANISHDLRTPLNAIIGFSQALNSNIFGKLNKKQSEYIKDIHISSLHLLGMINEILDISKFEAHVMKLNKTEFCSNQAIEEVVNILEPLYKNKEINLKYNSKYKGNIKADYQKFQQILYNLLSNAIKFTNNKGKITITTESTNKDFILKIKDTGIGIDKKDHSKIFKKFVHLDNIYNSNSTGLGLTITKELTKLHKGTIFLESELNKGATFTLVFKNMIAK